MKKSFYDDYWDDDEYYGDSKQRQHLLDYVKRVGEYKGSVQHERGERQFYDMPDGYTVQFVIDNVLDEITDVWRTSNFSEWNFPEIQKSSDIHSMIAQIRQNNNSLKKSRVGLNISKAKAYDVEDVIRRLKEEYFKKHYEEYRGKILTDHEYKSYLEWYAEKYMRQGYSREDALEKLSSGAVGGLGRIPQSVVTIPDLMSDIKDILISVGMTDENLISELQDYIIDHTFVNEDGNYIFEGEP